MMDAWRYTGVRGWSVSDMLQRASIMRDALGVWWRNKQQENQDKERWDHGLINEEVPGYGRDRAHGKSLERLQKTHAAPRPWWRETGILSSVAAAKCRRH